MNKKLKRKWVNDLRFGNHKQITHRLLNSEGGFCALGRLCVIANIPFFTVNKENVISESHDSYKILYNLISETACGEVVSLNDKQKASFSEIADWIEEHL